MKENEQKNNLETNIKLNTAKPIKKLKSKPVLNKKVKTIANHPKLPEAKKVPAKLPAPPIKRKELLLIHHLRVWDLRKEILLQNQINQKVINQLHQRVRVNVF